MREESRAALEREKAIFQAVVNGARNTHLVYLDREFNFVRVNETYAAGCGYTPEEMVGKNHFALYPHEENLAIFARVRDTGVGVGFRDKPFTFPDQPQRGVTYWDWTLLPVKGADGKVEGLVFSLVETTDRKRAEDAMLEENRRKSEFLATLSHELRNPLAPIRYALEVLEGDAGAEAQAQAREVIDRQLRHLVRLVDDLLDVTRIASNKLQLRRQVVPLERIVRQAIESALPHFERGGQRFGAGPIPADVWLDADHDRLVQVLTNLLNNASKFTPPGGHVSLDVETFDREVALRVSDTGIGLTPEDVGRVFDMFVQVADSSQAGLGIGLALAKGTVELHGGRVEAQSDGPGAGSTFSVYLPRAQSPEAAVDRNAAPLPDRRCRVLVVDDNLDAAEMMRTLLELHHHEVRRGGRRPRRAGRGCRVPARDRPLRHRAAAHRRLRTRAADPGGLAHGLDVPRGGDRLGAGRGPRAVARPRFRCPHHQAGRSRGAASAHRAGAAAISSATDTISLTPIGSTDSSMSNRALWCGWGRLSPMPSMAKAPGTFCR